MIRSSVSFPRRGTRWLSTLTGVNTSSIVSSGRIRHPRQQQQRQHVPRSQRNASVVVMDPVSYMTTNAAATTTATATATMMTTANRKLNDVIFSSCRRRYHGDSHSSRNGSSSSSSSSSHQDPQSFYNETQKRIMQKTKELHASIMPLNERLRGPLASHSDQGTALPSVLLVGNHSSGKSSFINYVLGRNVQTSGVAPTDDSFTIIAPGPVDRDRDGPAFIGDPDLGFGPLRQFGPTLMHHAQLKIRSDIASQFIMIDSPGMIDAPGNYTGMLGSSSSSSSSSSTTATTTPTMDRGYDFTGVIRWFAGRADIVCLFFDPDKPGTTGETLSVLLHALSGMDHKLLIVLNKADKFQRIQDFARAYGSLCWNLSKVIPRKDLPRIYTMCLPVSQQQQQQQQTTATETTGEGPADGTNVDGAAATSFNVPLGGGLHDLYTARDEVVAEVRRAPERRLDNVLTGLYDAAAQLQMHARIVRDVQTRYSRSYWRGKKREIGVAFAGGGLSSTFAVLSHYDILSVPVSVTVSVLAATILSTIGMTWYHGKQMEEWERLAYEPEELSAAFLRVHARQVDDGDEYTAAVWQRIRGSLGRTLRQDGLRSMSTVTDEDLRGLDKIMNDDLPALRRQVSPPHYGKE